MTQEEAQDLLSLIVADLGPDVARTQKLGNGEHVCIIKTRGLDYWCWTPTADYESFQRARTCSLCNRYYEHVKPCSACNRLVCQTCRVVAGGIKCKACYLTVVPDDTPFITAQ